MRALREPLDLLRLTDRGSPARARLVRRVHTLVRLCPAGNYSVATEHALIHVSPRRSIRRKPACVSQAS